MEVTDDVSEATGEDDIVSEAAGEPVFALASPDQLSGVRVGAPEGPPPTYDQVKAALLAVGEDDAAMVVFMRANRDLLDYRFLYRLTSEKLRATNLGDATQAAYLDAARARAVKAAQRFDAPLFKQVGEAEGRLGGLLAQYMQGKTPDATAVVAAAGSDADAVFAFWMVLIAAIAAWEVKLPTASIEAQAREKLGQLAELRSVLEADEALLARGEIAPLHTLFSEPAFDPTTGTVRAELRDRARASLAELAPTPLERLAIVRRIGCVYCQSVRHGFQAYNPMVQRSAALYDVLMHGSLQPLSAVDTCKPETPIDSNFVRVAYDADDLMSEQNIEIPLFW